MEKHVKNGVGTEKKEGGMTYKVVAHYYVTPGVMEPVPAYLGKRLQNARDTVKPMTPKQETEHQKVEAWVAEACPMTLKCGVMWGLLDGDRTTGKVYWTEQEQGWHINMAQGVGIDRFDMAYADYLKGV